MRGVIFVLCVLISFNINAQTVASIAGEDISLDEFKRMYEKNLLDKNKAYQKESVDEYFDLFVNYKLKLKEAEEQGLPEQRAVKDEIKLYEEQLIKSTFDEAIMDKLLAEAYQRSLEEVCVSHILLNVRNNAMTEDEKYVYEEALKIREQLLQGADFASMAQRKSRDVDSKFDGGSLGCFSALQISEYSFENAVYQLQPGQISMPVRTSWGYHIIKCDDRRPANGEVEAAHIFTRSNSFMKEEKNQEARDQIFEAYNALQKGADFADVAAEYSQDTDTKNIGGNLGRFSVGSYEADFENAIFAIKEVGEYSQPVKTRVGWHIFKLLDREKVPTFEEVETSLREQIVNDERYELAQRAYGETLKQKYGYEQEVENVDLFRKEAAPGITIRGWQIPSSYDLNSPFFTLGDQVYTASQFVNYVRNNHRRGRFLSFTRFLNNFESEILLDYHREMLTSEDSELKDLLEEYRNGVVIFNLMEKEVWGKKSPDEAALQGFFNRNKDNYQTEPQIKVNAYTARDSKDARKVNKYLKNSGGVLGIKHLQPKLPSSVLVSTKVFSMSEAFVNGVDLSKMGAIATANTNNGIEIYKSFEKIPGKTPAFADVKGKVLADYQKDLEGNWLDELRIKYPVEVNDSVLEQLYR